MKQVETKSVEYQMDPKVKLAIFYFEKNVSFEGSSWSLQGFLNQRADQIVKVIYHQGFTKEQDCYHVFYKPKN